MLLLLNKSFTLESSLLPALVHLKWLDFKQNNLEVVKFGALTKFVTILKELQPTSDSFLARFYF